MKEAVRSHGFTALGPLHEAFARLQGWGAFGAALLLGAVSALAFAPFHFTAVLVLSFTALIWMLDGARSHRKWGKAVFMRAWAFGVGFFLIGMHWTALPFLVEPEKTAWLIWLPLIVLPGGMALIWGAAASMAAAFWSSSPSRVFVFSLFFALGEWVRGHLFGGFPWNLAGTTWVPGGALSQAASIGGVYWLTLITVFVVSTPAALVDTREERSLVQRILPLTGAVIILALGWAWGAQRTSAPSPLTEHMIVLMDSGVPQDEKWEIGPDPVFQQYVEMLGQPGGAAGDIVIWPEGAVPTALLNDPNAMDIVSAYLGPRNLIVGTARYADAQDTGQREYFNSLAVLGSNANVAGPVTLYDKHRLVPFGELPATQIIPFGEAMSDILPGALQQLATNGFKPGSGPTLIITDDLPTFVPMICYEALYPNVPRDSNEEQIAEWLVVVSNDAWFGGGMGPEQHYAQNRYRSIETGLPMARVASRGASAIIDGYGREVLRAHPIEAVNEGWTTAYGRGALPAPAPVTIFQRRIGVVLYWLTISLFAALAFVSWRR